MPVKDPSKLPEYDNLEAKRLESTMQSALYYAIDYLEKYGELPVIEFRTRVGLASPQYVNVRVWIGEGEPVVSAQTGENDELRQELSGILRDIRNG